MNKNEHIIFQDIPYGGGKGKFHSVLLTTFAIDLIHFDMHMLNILRRKQVCSINVLIDRNQLDQSLQYVSPACLGRIGIEYCVSGIASKGAFHPKINFFAGDDAVLVLIGSGNLTVTGHGKNHEVFTGFMVDTNDESHRPLIEECWQYLKRFISQTGGFEQKRLLHEIPENCHYLKEVCEFEPHALNYINDDLEAALLYTESGNSILSQIAHIVPMDDVEKVTVVSPYFDENGATLENLLQQCPKASMDVLIQEHCTLPPREMISNPRVTFYDFNDTDRGKKMNPFKDFKRLAHAKILLFTTDDKSFCIVGSANATKAGLGTMERKGVNDECCVLYASRKTNFQKELGLGTKKKLRRELDDFDFPKKEQLSSHSNYRVRLQRAYYEGGKLYVQLEDVDMAYLDKLGIWLDEGSKAKVLTDYQIGGQFLSVTLNSNKKSWLCALCDETGNLVSNKVLVHKIELLDATNPSQATRLVNSFVSKIESEGYNGLEIAEMLTDIIGDFTQDNPQVSFSKSVSNKEKKQTSELPEISYNPDFDNDKVRSKSIVQIDRASRLIECIEENIRKSVRSMKEELIDEEENGNSETSNERSLNFETRAVVSIKKIKSYSDKADSVLKSYLRFVSQRSKYCSTSKRHISKDDLGFFAITMLASMDICYLSRFHYDFGYLRGVELSNCQKKLYYSLDMVMEHEGKDALVTFASFCKGYDKTELHDEDFIKKAHRAIRYALIYTWFLSKSERNSFLKKPVEEATKTLIEHWGLPSKDSLIAELEPLIDKYNRVFEFRHIERTVRELGCGCG